MEHGNYYVIYIIYIVHAFLSRGKQYYAEYKKGKSSKANKIKGSRLKKKKSMKTS